MAQATDLVVLISSSEGIIVKGMERKLQDAGVNVEHCMPVVNLVKKYDDRSAIYVVYLSGDADAMSDALIYINDIVREEEKDLIVIGRTQRNRSFRGIIRIYEYRNGCCALLIWKDLPLRYPICLNSARSE